MIKKASTRNMKLKLSLETVRPLIVDRLSRANGGVEVVTARTCFPMECMRLVD